MYLSTAPLLFRSGLNVGSIVASLHRCKHLLVLLFFRTCPLQCIHNLSLLKPLPHYLHQSLFPIHKLVLTVHAIKNKTTKHWLDGKQCDAIRITRTCNNTLPHTLSIAHMSYVSASPVSNSPYRCLRCFVVFSFLLFFCFFAKLTLQRMATL